MFFSFRMQQKTTYQALATAWLRALVSAHKDFVTDDIKHSDEVMMSLKLGELKEFPCISKCGWWIKDIWRDMYLSWTRLAAGTSVSIIKNELPKR